MSGLRLSNLNKETTYLLTYLGQHQCAANLHKLRTASSDNCGQRQIINRIVESCPLTEPAADDGLLQLHSADDNSVIVEQKTR